LIPGSPAIKLALTADNEKRDAAMHKDSEQETMEL